MSPMQKVISYVSASILVVSGVLVSFVAEEEGFGPKDKYGLYMAYPDPSPATGEAVPTICNGHTRGVKMGDRATKEQCEVWLKEDLEISARDVRRCVKVPITQDQFNALVSFNFNTGVLCISQLVRKLNAGQCFEAAKEFNSVPQRDKNGNIVMYNGHPVMKFTTGGGIPLNGLIKRRAKERKMFEKDCKG